MNIPHDIMRKVGEAVVNYRMIEPDDRIFIGLSGGKDSFVLAHVLYELQKKAPISFELVCGTFDPGFPDFGVDIIQSYAREQNWEFHSVKLDIAPLVAEKNFSDSPCALCSRLRRGHIYTLMDKLNCSKLALGHHADDVIISFLMSYFRGHGISTMGPNVPALENKRLIRPFALVPESKIADFAQEMHFPICGKCQYKSLLDQSGDRVFFRNLLVDIEKRIPDFRSLALKSMAKIEPDYLFDKNFLDFLKK